MYFHFRNKSEEQKHVKYTTNVLSAIKPVPHGLSIPVPEVTGDISEMECSSSTESEANVKDTWNTEQSTNQPKHLTQLELSDLTQDLNLTKESAQLLGSRLRENNLLATSTTYFWYRKRDEEFRKCFNYEKDHSPIYCQEISGLISTLGIVYVPPEWRLFLAHLQSLKAVLLHNGNKICSVPGGHCVKLTFQYSQYNWKICGVKSAYLVGPQNIPLPPLHTKLSLMKNYTKALDKDGPTFKFLQMKFPRTSETKLQAGVFDWPQIRELTKDKGFTVGMSAKEKSMDSCSGSNLKLSWKA